MERFTFFLCLFLVSGLSFKSYSSAVSHEQDAIQDKMRMAIGVALDIEYWEQNKDWQNGKDIKNIEEDVREGLERVKAAFKDNDDVTEQIIKEIDDYKSSLGTVEDNNERVEKLKKASEYLLDLVNESAYERHYKTFYQGVDNLDDGTEGNLWVDLWRFRRERRYMEVTETIKRLEGFNDILKEQNALLEKLTDQERDYLEKQIGKTEKAINDLEEQILLGVKKRVPKSVEMLQKERAELVDKWIERSEYDFETPILPLLESKFKRLKSDDNKDKLRASIDEYKSLLKQMEQESEIVERLNFEEKLMKEIEKEDLLKDVSEIDKQLILKTTLQGVGSGITVDDEIDMLNHMGIKLGDFKSRETVIISDQTGDPQKLYIEKAINKKEDQGGPYELIVLYSPEEEHKSVLSILKKDDGSYELDYRDSNFARIWSSKSITDKELNSVKSYIKDKFSVDENNIKVINTPTVINQVDGLCVVHSALCAGYKAKVLKGESIIKNEIENVYKEYIKLFAYSSDKEGFVADLFKKYIKKFNLEIDGSFNESKAKDLKKVLEQLDIQERLPIGKYVSYMIEKKEGLSDEAKGYLEPMIDYYREKASADQELELIRLELDQKQTLTDKRRFQLIELELNQEKDMTPDRRYELLMEVIQDKKVFVDNGLDLNQIESVIQDSYKKMAKNDEERPYLFKAVTSELELAENQDQALTNQRRWTLLKFLINNKDEFKVADKKIDSYRKKLPLNEQLKLIHLELGQEQTTDERRYELLTAVVKNKKILVDNGIGLDQIESVIKDSYENMNQSDVLKFKIFELERAQEQEHVLKPTRRYELLKDIIENKEFISSKELKIIDYHRGKLPAEQRVYLMRLELNNKNILTTNVQRKRLLKGLIIEEEKNLKPDILLKRRIMAQHRANVRFKGSKIEKKGPIKPNVNILGNTSYDNKNVPQIRIKKNRGRNHPLHQSLDRDLRSSLAHGGQLVTPSPEGIDAPSRSYSRHVMNRSQVGVYPDQRYLQFPNVPSPGGSFFVSDQQKVQVNQKKRYNYNDNSFDTETGRNRPGVTQKKFFKKDKIKIDPKFLNKNRKFVSKNVKFDFSSWKGNTNHNLEDNRKFKKALPSLSKEREIISNSKVIEHKSGAGFGSSRGLLLLRDYEEE